MHKNDACAADASCAGRVTLKAAATFAMDTSDLVLPEAGEDVGASPLAAAIAGSLMTALDSEMPGLTADQITVLAISLGEGGLVVEYSIAVPAAQATDSAKVAATADSKKAEGNKFFAARDYTPAAACYSEAIAIDKTNPAYFCNRAGCHLNRRDWAEAIADAAEALAGADRVYDAAQLCDRYAAENKAMKRAAADYYLCLLYTSDAADE